MTETLYIRLPSRADEVIPWLIFSESEKEIIASGELNGAAELPQLTEKANARSVLTFVSTADIALKQLKVPGNSQRAIVLAAPYMLEDDLAQDVEQLFFAFAKIKNDQQENNCFVAVVEHKQMQQWQAWLNDANIVCKVMIPDVLALPEPKRGSNDENNSCWNSITLGDQVLVRQSVWQGFNVDLNIWPAVEQSLAKSIASEDEMPTINSYSTLAAEHFSVNAMPEELPLALFAEHAKTQHFNLLQGQYVVKQTRSPLVATWLTAAALTGIALLFSVGLKVTKLQQITAQQQAIEQNIVKLYKKTFPKTKRVKVSTVRSQLKRELAKYGASGEQGGFLKMFEKIMPAFAAVPQLKPESLKFDSKRQEFRIQALASGYQYFEKFKNQLEKAQLKVNQGSLNNQGDQVSGSFSIKG